MIVWLASYPRSGSTFFRLLTKVVYGLQTHSEYDDQLFDRLEGLAKTIGHEKLPCSVEQMRGGSDVYFVKTHGLPKDDSPAIYLVRDGRDALVSYARYRESFRNWSMIQRLKRRLGLNPFRSTLKGLIVQDEQYGGWSENVKQWRRRTGTRITIRYEDLIKEPVGLISEALAAVGYRVHAKADSSVPSFRELNERWPQFFRKGRIGSWKEEMPASLHRLFWKHHGGAMQELGYE